MIGIYKITNPKNKIYVGQSTNIENRFYTYKKNITKAKCQVKLYRSIIKYGVKSHIFEIIEECYETILNERERYWQDFYDVLNPEIGLNCRLTSTINRSGKLSEETKIKISESNLGRICTDETRKKISIGNKGRIPGKETREKLSKNHSRHNALLSDDEVIDICEIYNNGGTTKIVKEKYPHLKDCVLSQIRNKKTYKNITSRYDLKKPSKKGCERKFNKILCVEDNLIFDGLKDVANYYGVSISNISAIIHKKMKKNRIKKSFRYV